MLFREDKSLDSFSAAKFALDMHDVVLENTCSVAGLFDEEYERQLPGAVDLHGAAVILQVTPKEVVPSDAPTTLIVHNLPKCYGREDVIRELETLGFEGCFDFVHVPVGKHVWANLGYAFVNFIDDVIAERFQRVLTTHRYQRGHGPGRAARASVALVQGLEKNMAHHEQTRASSLRKERQPVVVANLSQMLL